MARKNRVSVPDACYNITMRCCNRAFNLRNPAFRERIAGWIYSTAEFAGVDVLAWTIMDNHIHLMVHVRRVPLQYWLDKACEPRSWAYIMRGGQVRTPRYQPDLADARPEITCSGDRPSDGAVVKSIAEGMPLVRIPGAPTGFTMSEPEMLERLRSLYANHTRGAEAVAKKWKEMHEDGRDDEIEAEMDAFCRRMYNISAYVKTLNQRISETFNLETGHTGHFWEGRFHSSVVDRDEAAYAAVSAYFALNPVRAKIVKNTEDWMSSSWSAALDPISPFYTAARRGYEFMFGTWSRAKECVGGMIAAKLPAEYDPEVDPLGYKIIGADGRKKYVPLTLAELVHVKVPAMTRDGYIARDRGFRARALEVLPATFPAPGFRSLDTFAKIAWPGRMENVKWRMQGVKLVVKSA